MRRTTRHRLLLSGFGIVTGVSSLVANAADPGAKPREPSWFHQVEQDRDRGAGRIVDDLNWEAQRLEDRRDVRTGRLKPRREFNRLAEERDRAEQIEAALRRQAGIGFARPADRSPLLRGDSSRSTGGELPSLAMVVARDQRELAEARETLGRSLRAVDAAEARALRTLRRRLTREGRPDHYDVERKPVEKSFNATRDAHRQAYERTRSRIVGHAVKP